MNRFFILSVKILSIFIIAIFYSHKVYADETETILKQLQILQEDIKTLEKPFTAKKLIQYLILTCLLIAVTY